MVRIRRTPRRSDAFMVPRPAPGEPGRFVVDATWGRINPIELAPGVRTISEVELVAHIERGLPVIDCRLPHYFAAGTIPSARSVPHGEAAARMHELDQSVETVLFCNGPQCAATPDAVGALLAAGYPPGRIVYYRGGMHDWVTLGLPVERHKGYAKTRPGTAGVRRNPRDGEPKRTTAGAAAHRAAR